MGVFLLDSTILLAPLDRNQRKAQSNKKLSVDQSSDSFRLPSGSSSGLSGSLPLFPAAKTTLCEETDIPGLHQPRGCMSMSNQRHKQLPYIFKLVLKKAALSSRVNRGQKSSLPCMSKMTNTSSWGKQQTPQVSLPKPTQLMKLFMKVMFKETFPAHHPQVTTLSSPSRLKVSQRP